MGSGKLRVESLKWKTESGKLWNCHGGIRDSFVKEHVSDEKYDNPDEAIEAINRLGVRDMWSGSFQSIRRGVRGSR